MYSLKQLHAEIDERVAAVRAGRHDWPCRQGCDSCCRRLAEVPELTEREWLLLRQGLASLPKDRLQEIGRGIAALAGQSARPLICPMLDQAAGLCSVYAYRPLACRTYGFYRQRDRGLYCKEIDARVEGGGLADVVWGNHDAIDRRLRELGELRGLPQWFSLAAPAID
ncbi:MULTISPECIES: YkgJ family cysteine cluster protein [Methylomonas]|uniref:YkgJ family cysteine cluster protein n=1 Tax=Methylomonas TaxID=416 RepID=UPI001232B706|nr:YkgJ family cysteine cluster protein [Methylomonas rhizoryzae]